MDYSIYIDEISKCNTERLTEKERVVLAKIIKSAYSSGGISHYLKLKRHRVDFAEGPYLNNLIKKGFVETRRGNFLLEGTSYDLTACCLILYISKYAELSESALTKISRQYHFKNVGISIFHA